MFFCFYPQLPRGSSHWKRQKNNFTSSTTIFHTIVRGSLQNIPSREIFSANKLTFSSPIQSQLALDSTENCDMLCSAQYLFSLHIFLFCLASGWRTLYHGGTWMLPRSPLSRCCSVSRRWNQPLRACKTRIVSCVRRVAPCASNSDSNDVPVPDKPHPFGGAIAKKFPKTSKNAPVENPVIQGRTVPCRNTSTKRSNNHWTVVPSAAVP